MRGTYILLATLAHTHAFDNGAPYSRLPPMGWSSWDALAAGAGVSKQDLESLSPAPRPFITLNLCNNTVEDTVATLERLFPCRRLYCGTQFLHFCIAPARILRKLSSTPFLLLLFSSGIIQTTQSEIFAIRSQ